MPWIYPIRCAHIFYSAHAACFVFWFHLCTAACARSSGNQTDAMVLETVASTTSHSSERPLSYALPRAPQSHLKLASLKRAFPKNSKQQGRADPAGNGLARRLSPHAGKNRARAAPPIRCNQRARRAICLGEGPWRKSPQTSRTWRSKDDSLSTGLKIGRIDWPQLCDASLCTSRSNTAPATHTADL